MQIGLATAFAPRGGLCIAGEGVVVIAALLWVSQFLGPPAECGDGFVRGVSNSMASYADMVSRLRVL